MATVETQTIRYDSGAAEAAKISFADLFDMSGASLDGLAECVSGLFDEKFVSGDELRDLLRGEAFDLAACRASKLDGLKIEPCDAYLMLFAAIAGHANKYSIRISHGWPSFASD